MWNFDIVKALCLFMGGRMYKIIIYLYMDNTAFLFSHRGCSNDTIRPTLVLRPSTILSLLCRQF